VDAVVHDTIAREKIVLNIDHFDLWYGEKQALFDINMEIYRGEILAFMGPSGCGKTTLLKLLNRMQDDVPGAHMTGKITFNGQDINDPDLDPVTLRKHFGWVAQAPNPFPKSIRENVSYGALIHSIVSEGPEMDAHVRECLEQARLWEEVSDRLDEAGTDLSGGQQQRLCIARALSILPDIMLMDEPCSAIDPIASDHVEKLVLGLKERMGIVIITHNLQQAQRLADRVAFFHLGNLVEYGDAKRIFSAPEHEVTARYLEGAFG